MAAVAAAAPGIIAGGKGGRGTRLPPLALVVHVAVALVRKVAHAEAAPQQRALLPVLREDGVGGRQRRGGADDRRLLAVARLLLKGVLF